MHAKQRKFKQCEFVFAAFSYGMKTYPGLMLRHPQPSCKEYQVQYKITNQNLRKGIADQKLLTHLSYKS